MLPYIMPKGHSNHASTYLPQWQSDSPLYLPPKFLYDDPWCSKTRQDIRLTKDLHNGRDVRIDILHQSLSAHIIYMSRRRIPVYLTVISFSLVSVTTLRCRSRVVNRLDECFPSWSWICCKPRILPASPNSEVWPGSESLRLVQSSLYNVIQHG